MNRSHARQSLGQMFYEIHAANDKTSQIWPEWRELPRDHQAFWESYTAELIQKQQDEEKNEGQTDDGGESVSTV